MESSIDSVIFVMVDKCGHLYINIALFWAEENYIPDWLRKYKYEHWDIIDDFSTPEILAEDVKSIKSKVEILFSDFTSKH